jgi:predicted RNase H-like HicB family nuclease
MLSGTLQIMTTTLTYEYWRDGGWYVGQLREVPGVFSQGKTVAELEDNLRDAYQLVLKNRPAVRRRATVHRRRLTVAV